QSGAGKSTLLNKLDNSLNLKTDEISLALNRGKHTTRHTELISMLDGLVADTPGFSSLDLSSIPKSDIRDNFIEFNLYRDKCKYRDCMHIKEDTCKIKEELDNNILKSRYDNYIKLLKETK
ncbi:MAG: ribosome small subunit-dependent GTPase A, partial [Bacilli bacterium]|nr:ribosome small subunit-dependent GTPase A [Bacilli bacterium]